MTIEQKREYNREAMRKHRLLHGPNRRPTPKPDRWTCKKCGVEKPYEEPYFYKGPTHKWGLNKTCAECSRFYCLARKFNISVEDYKKLTTGRCAICETEGRLFLDHCHDSGNIREGLCLSCNTGLGMFRDDPDRLRAAALYVERHRLLT